MKTVIALLLIASAAFGIVTDESKLPPDEPYDITITSDNDGFIVTYCCIVYVTGHTDQAMYFDDGTNCCFVYRIKCFRVQSLTEILPTPEAMRAAGRKELSK